jgi:hypothetical protein
MDKVKFKAVSCGAAINLQGEVVAYKTFNGAYNIDHFIQYLRLLRARIHKSPLHLVLDNLHVHKSSVVEHTVRKIKLFNASHHATRASICVLRNLGEYKTKLASRAPPTADEEANSKPCAQVNPPICGEGIPLSPKNAYQVMRQTNAIMAGL